MSGKSYSITVKFKGEELVIDWLEADATVSHLKEALYARTRVLPATQKICGLRSHSNEPVHDAMTLSELVLKPGSKFMLIGSTQEAVDSASQIKQIRLPEFADDAVFEQEEIKICHLPEHLDKVKRRSKAYKPRMLAEPRPGKRLLVLDIDYTIFGRHLELISILPDHLSPAESVQLLARPYLHDFLERAHRHYDIAIWSATNMMWILAKLTQLGLISQHSAGLLRRQSRSNLPHVDEQSTAGSTADPHPLFTISLVLDSSDMISVYFPEHGVKEVKPLSVIWDNHAHWGPHNTIMFDDIRRNFAMNPQTGLRIRPFRDAHANRKKDRELRGLASYLELIAKLESDFTRLNHNHWERYVSRNKHAVRDRRDSSTPTDNSTSIQDVVVADDSFPTTVDENDCPTPTDGVCEPDRP